MIILVSRPTLRHFYFMRYMTLYARAQAGDHGHPRASALAVLSVVPVVLDIQENHVNFEFTSVTATPGKRGDFSSSGNTWRSTRARRRVTMVTRARPRARCSLWCPYYWTCKKANVNFEFKSVTAKLSL